MTDTATYSIANWKWAINNSDLSPAEKLVAHTISVRMNSDGTIPARFRPNIETIRKGTGYKKVRTVSAAIASLEAKGWLTVDRGTGRTVSNYTIAFPPGVPIFSTAEKGHPRGAEKGHPSDRSGSFDGTPGVPKNGTPALPKNGTHPPRVPPQGSSTEILSSTNATTFAADSSNATAPADAESILRDLREELALYVPDPVPKSTVVKLAGPIAQDRRIRKPRTHAGIIEGKDGWDDPEMLEVLVDAVAHLANADSEAERHLRAIGGEAS